MVGASFEWLPKRLPPLKGAWLIVFRAILAWSFIAAVVETVAFDYPYARMEERRVNASYALGIAVNLQGSMAFASPRHADARRAGLSGNEQILAIDDRPVPDDRDMLTHTLEGPPGSKLRLSVRNPVDGVQRTIELTRSQTHIDAMYRGTGLAPASHIRAYYWGTLATRLLMIVASILLISRRPRDMVAALIALGFTVPGDFGLALLGVHPSPLIDKLLEGVAAVPIVLGLMLFPSGRFEPRWSWAGVVLIALMPLSVLALPFVPIFFALNQYAMLVAALFAAAVMLARYRRIPPGTERQQVKFAVLGFVGMALLFLVDVAFRYLNVTLPPGLASVWLRFAVPIVDTIANFMMAGGLLIALLRYRLYDADAVISRSAAYALLTVMLGAAFAGSEKMIEVLGEEFFGESMRALSAGLGAAVAAMLIAPLHGRVHHWAEKRFQRQLVGLKRDLPALVGDLREVSSLDHLLAAVVRRIERGVRATRAAVLLREEGGLDLVRTSDIDEGDVTAWRRGWHPRGDVKGVECDRDDAVFPIRVPLRSDGAGEIGWILLGPRPDGTFYGKDERDALAEVADPIARAIHIVRQRAAREAALERRMMALIEQRLAEGAVAAV